MTVRLSQTTKMPCKSWSLEAVKTCPGSHNANGKLVQVCQGCYADTGFYKMKNAVKLRQENREDWKRWDWVDDMVDLLKDEDYFRWFDSGDIYHPDLAAKIYEVMKITNFTLHWLPTRSHKIPRIKLWLTKMKRLPNVSVRYSSDRVNQFNRRVHGSMVYDSTKRKGSDKILSVEICRASTQGGKCGDCRACWDKTICVIGYPAHGATMKKILDTRIET
jgi:hypothetical protein